MNASRQVHLNTRMKHEILPNGYLRISITQEEADNYLGELEGEDLSRIDESDFFEPLTCNSELNWLREGITDDLTNAPMLAIRGDTVAHVCEDGDGYEPVGRWDGKDQARPILFRWGFMAYETKNMAEELIKNLSITLEGGVYIEA